MLKKLLISILTALIITAIIPITGTFSNEVFANEYYSMGCGINEFEVSYIEDDGTFTMMSCHSTFSEAKKAMKANKDFVVRYAKSYSPSGIVAMNSGLAYSYPGRGNSAIMNLYQDPANKNSSKYKTTYIENHYEMTYIDTCEEDVYDIKTNGKGYIRVVMNGFEGFTDLEYTDLVPTKFLENNLGIWLGGLNVYEGESPFFVKPLQNYYEIKDNGNYTDLVFHFYRAYPKSGTSPISYEYSVDNASNYPFMEKGKKYYSNDGINFYSDRLLTSFVGKAYNYYQFLPLRSTTDIPGDVFDRFLNNIRPDSYSVMRNEGQTFVDAQYKYGCNGLLVYAMACLESAYGTSGYATNRYNLFGWSAYDNSPNDASYFTSVKHCVQEHMGRNLRWFMDWSNRRYFGSCVGNKGAGFNVMYASDPYWGVKIASIAYSIDKFANNKNGKLTDYNKYALGFVKDNYNDVLYGSNIEWNPDIYVGPTGSDFLYNGSYGSHYQKDLTVIILEEDLNRYKIQSTNNVDEDQCIVTADGVFKYDWDLSVGYLDKDNVVLLNNVEIPKAAVEHIHNISLREVDINSETLKLNGVGVISGYNYTKPESVKQEVVFYDLENNENKYIFQAETIDSDGYTLFDGFDYTYTGFDLSINLTKNELPLGSYSVKLVTTYGNTTMESYLGTSYVDYRYMSADTENRTYFVKMNETSYYRMQLDVMSMPETLSFSEIDKPSKRNSLSALDGFSMDEDGKITIEGHGFIYYSEFDNKEETEFKVYLVDTNDNYLILNTTIVDSDIDYQQELGTSFKLDNISFVATSESTEKNAFDLNGNYTVYLSIRNKDKFDICEMANWGFDDITVSNETKNVTFYTSNIRRRLMIKTSSVD